MVTLNTIKAEVFKRRPVLGEIYGTFGSQVLLDYIRQWPVPNVALDPLFMQAVFSVSENIFGSFIAQHISGQLQQQPLVSTIDHHGLWGHPIFVNADVLYSLHFQNSEIAVALATESVSLNNTSSWSASILHHGAKGDLVRASLLKDKYKNLPVLSAPAITETHIARVEKLHPEICAVIEAAEMQTNISAKDFSTQASILSNILWKKVFPSAPNLFYIPLERTVGWFLQNLSPSHPVHTLVFTEQGREVWKQVFPNEHTYLFWQLDHKNRRQPLAHIQNSEEIEHNIKTGRWYASSPLCFAVLLVSGVACVGGFTQTTWLTAIAEKLSEAYIKLGLTDTAHFVRGIPTKFFAESALAFLRVQNGIIRPTAADLLASGKDWYGAFANLARKITLQTSIDLNLPTIYSVVVPKSEQGPAFNLAAMEKQALKESGIEHLLTSPKTLL